MQSAPIASSSGRGFSGLAQPQSRRLAVVRPHASSSRTEFETKAADAARAVGKSLEDLGGRAQDAARRTWRRLDSEHSLSEKAERMGKRAAEQLRDIDQTYNVRQKVRNTVDHAVRMWPTWSRQLDEFGQTWYGKTTIFLGLALILSSPLFWRLLNIVLLIWWLFIPMGVVLLQATQQKRAQEMAARAAAEAKRRRNPFASMWRDMQGASTSTSSSSRYTGSASGPVVDAEYVVLDSEKGGSSKRS